MSGWTPPGLDEFWRPGLELFEEWYGRFQLWRIKMPVCPLPQSVITHHDQWGILITRTHRELYLLALSPCWNWELACLRVSDDLIRVVKEGYDEQDGDGGDSVVHSQMVALVPEDHVERLWVELEKGVGSDVDAAVERLQSQKLDKRHPMGEAVWKKVASVLKREADIRDV